MCISLITSTIKQIRASEDQNGVILTSRGLPSKRRMGIVHNLFSKDPLGGKAILLGLFLEEAGLK